MTVNGDGESPSVPLQRPNSEAGRNSKLARHSFHSNISFYNMTPVESMLRSGRHFWSYIAALIAMTPPPSPSARHRYCRRHRHSTTPQQQRAATPTLPTTPARPITITIPPLTRLPLAPPTSQVPPAISTITTLTTPSPLTTGHRPYTSTGTIAAHTSPTPTNTKDLADLAWLWAANAGPSEAGRCETRHGVTRCLTMRRAVTQCGRYVAVWCDRPSSSALPRRGGHCRAP